MKLLETYEDLFQFVCRLNRVAKTDAQPDYGRIRSEVKTVLDEINRRAVADVQLMNQVKKLELPIIFFVDNLICTSRLKFAPQWAENRLAKERNELAGDERFFDFLEQDLTDPGEEAAERLAVYYTCFGLGFMGMYLSQPEKIRQYQEQIYPRLGRWMDRDPSRKITEEAYQSTDTRVLTEPPSRKIILVAILFLFLSLSVLAVYYGLYAKASYDLTNSIDQIMEKAQASK
ncbi:MAG TPA: DotU family type IV/VI secretion system protein [Verrucomicrobiae bacterium]|jgi:type IV/VI secretion system ImpK/VasF family protein|nr:DotU family type IV/VI secretion system protein [Verrucomicrobiae bacterium]